MALTTQKSRCSGCGCLYVKDYRRKTDGVCWSCKEYRSEQIRGKIALMMVATANDLKFAASRLNMNVNTVNYHWSQVQRMIKEGTTERSGIRQ